MLRRKKLLELTCLKNYLSHTTFFSIVSIREEHTEEFFTFKNDLFTKGFVCVKFKKNYHDSLLGLQTRNMLPRLGGINYLIVLKDQDFCDISSYLIILKQFSPTIVHIYSYFSPFLCCLEKLQGISRNYENQTPRTQLVALLPRTLTNFVKISHTDLLLPIIYLVFFARKQKAGLA